MKVCLRRGYHHVFDDLVSHPPKGVSYTIPKMASSGGQSGIVNVLKRKGWRLYSNVLQKPNAIKLNTGGKVDLIHSNSGFLIKNDMPWVVDVEHVATFVGYEAGGRLDKSKSEIESYLSSENCKMIMPWTNAGAKSIRSGLSSRKFDKKIEVVYPAISPAKVTKKKHSGMNLLFVSYGFFNKAGKEVLEACSQLQSKYDFNLTMVSDVPESYKKIYPNFNYVKPDLPRNVLMEKYYSTADIFVLPSYMDTFGLVYLEAMGAGLPIVASNVFAVPEIVGKSGLLVDIGRYSWFGKDGLFAWKSWQELEKILRDESKPEIISQIRGSIAKLIDSKSLRTKMINSGKKEISSGKFSISRRNAQLKKIYEHSIRK